MSPIFSHNFRLGPRILLSAAGLSISNSLFSTQIHHFSNEINIFLIQIYTFHMYVNLVWKSEVYEVQAELEVMT